MRVIVLTVAVCFCIVSISEAAEAQTLKRTAGDLCGALDEVVEKYAPELGFAVSGTDHEEFLPDEIFCRWVAPNGLDFMKVEFTFDAFAYNRSRDTYLEYAGRPGALALGDAVIVLTPGGWSVEVAPIPNSGIAVQAGPRDDVLDAAVSVAVQAGGV